MKKSRTYFYSAKQDDELMIPPKAIKKITGDYPYVRHSLSSRVLAFIAYRLIATPIAFVHTRLIKRIKIVNKSSLRPYLKDGYFIYANHTQVHADAFAPSIILFPKRNYTIVNANNVSLPGLGNATKLLGALPLPDDLTAGKHFIRALDQRIREGHSVLIYPEAHIWPYYTGIRPFEDHSFKYPLKQDTPTFVFTTTYQKKVKRGYRIIMYVDGPYYAPLNLDRKQRQSYLHDQVITVMRQRSATSNFNKFNYQLKETL